MKKIMLTYYFTAVLVSVAFSFLMNVNNWVEFLKNIICSSLAASLVILAGQELQWSPHKILIGIIIACGYARPIVYGVNGQIKEFFKDPQAYIEKYKGKK